MNRYLLDPFVYIVTKYIPYEEIYDLRLVCKEVDKLLREHVDLKFPRLIEYFSDFAKDGKYFRFRYNGNNYYINVSGSDYCFNIYDDNLRVLRKLSPWPHDTNNMYAKFIWTNEGMVTVTYNTPQHVIIPGYYRNTIGNYTSLSRDKNGDILIKVDLPRCPNKKTCITTPLSELSYHSYCLSGIMTCFTEDGRLLVLICELIEYDDD